MLPNCPQAVIGYYGTLLAGGIVVQTNPLYTERELEYQLHDSGAKVILCLDLVFPRVTNVQSATKIEHIIVTRIADFALPKIYCIHLCRKTVKFSCESIRE